MLMKLSEFNQYVIDQGNSLTKTEPTFEVDESGEDFYLIKLKSTFVYGSEEEADAKVDEVRQSFNFAGVEKKFKAGKVSKKTGEELSPDTYTVVVKYKFE